MNFPRREEATNKELVLTIIEIQGYLSRYGKSHTNWHETLNEVIKISILGVIVNLSLIVMKLTVGIISKSQSMIADAIHSIQDVFASILTYIGANFSNKKRMICIHMVIVK